MKIKLQATKYPCAEGVSIDSNLTINFPISELFLEKDDIELRLLKNLNLETKINDDIYIKANEYNINKVKEYIHSENFILFLNDNYKMDFKKCFIKEIDIDSDLHIKKIEMMLIISDNENSIIDNIKELECETFKFFFEKTKNLKNFSIVSSLYISIEYLFSENKQQKSSLKSFKSNIRVLKNISDFQNLKDIIDSYFSKFEKHRIKYNNTNEFHIFEIDFYVNDKG